jgi:hypothetical protein
MKRRASDIRSDKVLISGEQALKCHRAALDSE